MTQTPNTPDLGELSSRLLELAMGHPKAELLVAAAEALAAEHARAEALEKERDALLPDDPWHWKNRARKAEAEVAALQARVAAFLTAYDAVAASDVAEPWDRARSERVTSEEQAALAELRAALAAAEGRGEQAAIPTTQPGR